MATVLDTANTVESVPELPAHLRKLFRAFVTPRNSCEPERTFFVEALTHQAAVKKIAGTIAALEYSNLFAQCHLSSRSPGQGCTAHHKAVQLQ